MQALGRFVHLVDTEYPQSYPVRLWRKKPPAGGFFHGGANRAGAPAAHAFMALGKMGVACCLQRENQGSAFAADGFARWRNKGCADGAVRPFFRRGKAFLLLCRQSCAQLVRLYAWRAQQSPRRRGAGVNRTGWRPCSNAPWMGPGLAPAWQAGAVQQARRTQKKCRKSSSFSGFAVSGAWGAVRLFLRPGAAL